MNVYRVVVGREIRDDVYVEAPDFFSAHQYAVHLADEGTADVGYGDLADETTEETVFVDDVPPEVAKLDMSNVFRWDERGKHEFTPPSEERKQQVFLRILRPDTSNYIANVFEPAAILDCLGWEDDPSGEHPAVLWLRAQLREAHEALSQ